MFTNFRKQYKILLVFFDHNTNKTYYWTAEKTTILFVFITSSYVVIYNIYIYNSLQNNRKLLLLKNASNSDITY